MDSWDDSASLFLFQRDNSVFRVSISANPSRFRPFHSDGEEARSSSAAKPMPQMRFKRLASTSTRSRDFSKKSRISLSAENFARLPRRTIPYRCSSQVFLEAFYLTAECLRCTGVGCK